MCDLSRYNGGNRKAQAGAVLTLLALAFMLGCHSTAGCCNIVSGDLTFSKDEAMWTIKNSGDSPITICSISLEWPIQNGNLLAVALDSPTIFNQNRNPTVTTIDSGWCGQEPKRTINPGCTSTLKLLFRNTAKTTASNYNLRVNFCPCTAEFPQPSSSDCDITGPSIVCDTESVRYNASVNEVLPYGYNYNWWVDDSIAGTGRDIEINWGPYSAGNHTLNLNVSQTYGETALFSQCCKQVLVIKKPIVKITVIKM